MDVGTGPWESGIEFYNQCGSVPLSFTEVFPNINALAEFVGFGVSEFYVGGTYSYTINGTVITWTWTWTEDPLTTECGAIAAANASEFSTVWAPFIPVEAELCPTCQDVVFANCSNQLFIYIPGLNGYHLVRIENHQTGITYFQSLEFDAGEVNWDTSATPGLFNPFNIYTLTVLDGNNNPISWFKDNAEYNCMRLIFKTVTNATPS